MLYKFQSRAASDLLMLEPQGRRILQIIGKHGEDRRGILRPGDMPAAITALETAILREEQEATEAQAEEEDGSEQAVSLRQRAAPFIDMLRHSLAADADVVWGV
ncbi:hypothetical protein AZ34_04095 [Hylemonella gracilis str. Niagara R]|uniref:DUF1840 domain-containing protein n=1 Tax=Hylemonella gracilis str. Niagara R TaxID=1458275 RepID=A0A016XER5_9BURK|nr:DUF1840 domain-containing protein [Hylemonella gracilis]EYC50336.1 hypothetical protein AZ34_04095 [Hylemonella gracilis str. Niagara R]